MALLLMRRNSAPEYKHPNNHWKEHDILKIYIFRVFFILYNTYEG